jgi:hypothetical protein
MSLEQDTDNTENADNTENTENTENTVESKRRRPSKAVLVAGGVGVIGLLAGGGIGFGIGHDSGTSSTTAGSSATLSLPTSLTGGYKRSTSVDTNIKTAVASAQTTLGAGTDMALYTKNKTQILVEATRLPGDALLQAGMTYAKVGDDVCATTSSTSGTEAICSRSSGQLTVKVTAGTSAVASMYVDQVFNALA